VPRIILHLLTAASVSLFHAAPEIFLQIVTESRVERLGRESKAPVILVVGHSHWVLEALLELASALTNVSGWATYPASAQPYFQITPHSAP